MKWNMFKSNGVCLSLGKQKDIIQESPLNISQATYVSTCIRSAESLLNVLNAITVSSFAPQPGPETDLAVTQVTRSGRSNASAVFVFNE